ncbi:HSP20-like chaperone [Neocallimastix lanati (nom. inval.)]|uniref:HSP20-like chaperone n=1 Tax=Neocallimastix californiae TaxID=1754190 RepID=A0A1Y2B807_9FUNG|nr:HSP20-like chaperone [Neocallimastix sp. JGI-2020a]ORY30627.1 HSP20-like chaperone [Neocallimastix californiae]|eukprot:ORY30627.1 HSP20-like chaperone [Neocallimastix californiae]
MSSHNNENQLSHRNNNSLFEDSFFDNQFENDFFNHPLISFPSIYPYYHRDPFNDLHNQISKAFNSDVFKSVDFSPKINLSEDENNYYIHADLPGMNKDQVKMELSDDNHVLTISGERESIIDNSDNNNNNDNIKDYNKNKENSNKRNTKKYSKIECSYGKFSRSFTLPENADINKIQARLENGVLEVHLPKLEPTKKEQRKTIQIQ